MAGAAPHLPTRWRRSALAGGNTCVTIVLVPVLTEFLDERGRSPFARWLRDLTSPAALKVNTALGRLEAGNTSALKAVGRGVSELRVDFGPGYRVYLGQDGGALVVLLGGGTKARQSDDVAEAQARWAAYRARKRGGEA